MSTVIPLNTSDAATRSNTQGQKPSGDFYIPSLDGIRAVSFLLVFFHHGILGGIVPGGFGVTTFFFLSGFLITTLLRMEAEQTGAISLRKFYLRRALRIFPPMYFAIAAATLLAYWGILPGQVSGTALLAQCLHFANYSKILWGERGPYGLGILWSLAVEEHFYLVFPLLYIFLRRHVPRPGFQATLLLGICACVLAWRIVLIYFLHATEFRTTFATDTRIDSILMGCILAIWGNPVLNPTQISTRLLNVMIAVALPVLIVSMALPAFEFRETFRYSLESISLYPLFIGAIRYYRWGVFRLLNLSWVRFMGVLSYSLYLIHHPILYILHRWMPFPPPPVTSWGLHLHEIIIDVLTLILSITLAWAMYRLIEKPCAKLRRKLTRTHKPASTLANP